MTYQAMRAMDSPSLFEDDEEVLEPLGDAEWQELYDRHMSGEELDDNERKRFDRYTFGING